VLVGGMTIGTFFTLFVVPSVYVLIARDHRHSRKDAAPPVAAEDDAHDPARAPRFDSGVAARVENA
jgi:multidrug efflux pump